MTEPSIGDVVEKLQALSSTAHAVLLRQVYLDASFEMAFSLLAAIGAVWFSRRRALESRVIALCIALLALGLLSDAAVKLLNPEYAAIHQLFER